MSQQTIEKMLKAIIANHGKENYPVHNLNRLAEIASISDELTSQQFDFLAELTPYHIEARYGDYKESLSEIINARGAGRIYEKTKGLHKWLYQKIK